MGEAEFYQQWQELTEAKPFDLAIAAGRLAESPGLIFLAGYQACIQATFPELDRGRWHTFAVSEDRSPNSERPGVTFADGKVSGFKTWIAGVNSVDGLVLKVGSGAEARYGVVEAKAEGVTLTEKPKPTDNPGFLPDMSQGVAEFRQATFTELNDASGVKNFQRFEPYYIYLAFLARLGSLNNELAGPANQVLEGQKNQQDLVQLDRDVSVLMTTMAESGLRLGTNWDMDHRLFTMYSKGIQAQSRGA